MCRQADQGGYYRRSGGNLQLTSDVYFLFKSQGSLKQKPSAKKYIIFIQRGNRL